MRFVFRYEQMYGREFRREILKLSLNSSTGTISANLRCLECLLKHYYYKGGKLMFVPTRIWDSLCFLIGEGIIKSPLLQLLYFSFPETSLTCLGQGGGRAAADPRVEPPGAARPEPGPGLPAPLLQRPAAGGLGGQARGLRGRQGGGQAEAEVTLPRQTSSGRQHQ